MSGNLAEQAIEKGCTNAPFAGVRGVPVIIDVVRSVIGFSNGRTRFEVS